MPLMATIENNMQESIQESLNLTLTSDAITVLLVEDHTLIRAGIRALLEKMDGIEAVGEAGDGHNALALASRLQPDVVLMDITLPGMDGLEAARRLQNDYPHIKVLMLTMHSSSEFVARALSYGASGYLLKESASSELEVAVRAVAQGNKYLSPAVSGHILEQYLKHSPDLVDPLSCLTARQREVFDLIVQGYTTKAMASHLSLSVKTVETHRQQLMQRLDIHDVAGLTRLSISLTSPSLDL